MYEFIEKLNEFLRNSNRDISAVLEHRPSYINGNAPYMLWVLFGNGGPGYGVFDDTDFEQEVLKRVYNRIDDLERRGYSTTIKM